ncbi:hypothetical protein [Sediminicola luteus]|nr:hypothetical protein [Sediminicola luteus]
MKKVLLAVAAIGLLFVNYSCDPDSANEESYELQSPEKKKIRAPGSNN